MVNSETGMSTHDTFGGEYQVFLSFRGPDTRHEFIDILHQALVHAGIRVFIDDDELQPGGRIFGNLERAIDESKLYIPIFSRNYASSHWCLRELAKMVEKTSMSKEDEKVMLPIFYNVKPEDVKLKTMLYKNAMSNLEQKMEDKKNKFSSEVIETWRQALKGVGGIKGWELEKYPSQAELIQVVVNAVMARLKRRERCVTKDLVGMEDRITYIKKLLDVDPNGVRLIGIYGMGGIGKTTLAKIIFNQLCSEFGKNCSFLHDVRETAESKDLVELQKRLLSDISYSSVAHTIDNVDIGSKRIEDTICNKKMLIVLDDVDKANQIQSLIGEKLYRGTRILVTTRDKSILNIRGFKYEFETYEMEQLNEKDSLKLFSKHAFNHDSPPTNYYTLSKRIVSTTDGLPLALEAIGSMLFNCNKKTIWEETLEKLRKIPHEDVLKKLRISYDALNTDQQQIFLDVACFFIGENKTNPMYVWKACEFGPELAIQVLIQRCMIKDLDDDRFGMHDQFRDLGKAIANDTRLWDKDDIIFKLRSREIKGSVQALDLAPSWDGTTATWDQITITSTQIKRFPHIRFLWLYRVICQGNFTGCLSELKWISLRYPYSIPPGPPGPRNQCLKATNLLHLENAVVVNLSGLDITENVFESLIKGARKLKVLNITCNSLIHGTSTFPAYSILEKLTLHEFLSLTEIDSSIGKLRWLTELRVESCSQLKNLPKQIGELRNLQHLSFRFCINLIELPNSVSKLEKLTKLDVTGTRIARLPDSIDRLRSLSFADVSLTRIEKLPSTMSQLLHLQTLHLRLCNWIQDLPKLPISLITLHLSSPSLLTVPNLSYLTNLVDLLLSDDFEATSRPKVTQTCDLQWIGRLSKLSKLHFCFPNVRAPTAQLGSLSLLEELTLYGLDLPTFKQLPSNLIVLQLYDTRGTRVHLDGLPPLEKETVSISSSSRKSRGKKVCEQLDVRFPDVLELPERSRIQDCESSERSDCLREEPGCNELQAPGLIDHWRGAILFPSSQNMLRKIYLSGFPEVQDIQFVSPFESLEEFSVKGCSSLKSLGGLSNSKYLKQLTIDQCPSLQVIEGIDELEFLHWLNIDGCRSMERIFDASISKIPSKCSILITCSGELPDCGRTFHTWDSYREKLLNGTKQAPGSEIETTDSETETGDALKKTNQENKEKKRKGKTESTKQQGRRKRIERA